jgi:hypothetical protein
MCIALVSGPLQYGTALYVLNKAQEKHFGGIGQVLGESVSCYEM